MADKPRDTNLPQHDYDLGHYGTLPLSSFPSGSDIGTVGIVIDNGASAITTGVKANIPLFFNVNIVGFEMVANLSGGVILDIQNGTRAAYPATSSIVGSGYPTMNSAIQYQNYVLSGWTTSLFDGDRIRFIVNSGSTITNLSCFLKLQRA